MNRVLYPLIFLMSSLPNTETHLENLNSMIMATQDSVKNIKTGLENFHNMMVELSQAGGSAGGKKDGPKVVEKVQPQQEVQYGENASVDDSTPSIMIPVATTAPDSINGKK